MAFGISDPMVQPGMTDTYDALTSDVLWLRDQPGPLYVHGLIDSTAVDAGSTPTTLLRAGLLMAYDFTNFKWYPYSANAATYLATAVGVLPFELSMLDAAGVAVNKRCPVLVGGAVKAASLINLDRTARRAMGGSFIFDDLQGKNEIMPYHRALRTVTGTTALTVADSGCTILVASTASATITLPTPTAALAGMSVLIINMADQDLLINCATNDLMVIMNDLTADSISFVTASQKIGAGGEFFCTGTKWVAQYRANGATVTTAT